VVLPRQLVLLVTHAATSRAVLRMSKV